MRFARPIAIGLWVALATSYGRADADSPAPSRMEPGLGDYVFKPFAEAEAFPLQTLLDYRSGSTLVTYRGRCLSLEVFGRTLTPQCEGRVAITYTGALTTIQWLTIGSQAIGLETVAPLDPPIDGVIRYAVGKVHILSGHDAKTEFAMGNCRVDAYYRRCQAIGQSGQVNATFATVGGQATQQYPIEDAVFRIPHSEVFTARGQCLSLLRPNDATPYCASFVGKAVLDRKAIVMLFTADARTVIGFYGLLKNSAVSSDSSFTLPITQILRIQGDSKAGTAPVEGTCRMKDEGGRIAVSCDAKTEREHASFQGSFQTSEPWKKAVRSDPN